MAHLVGRYGILDGIYSLEQIKSDPLLHPLFSSTGPVGWVVRVTNGCAKAEAPMTVAPVKADVKETPPYGDLITMWKRAGNTGRRPTKVNLVKWYEDGNA